MVSKILVIQIFYSIWLHEAGVMGICKWGLQMVIGMIASSPQKFFIFNFIFLTLHGDITISIYEKRGNKFYNFIQNEFN